MAHSSHHSPPGPLDAARLERFSRQIILPEIGGAGQVALSEAHIALIGLGGIGAPALQYLAGAGVGALTLIDDDQVALSNLPRQTIYSEADIGAPKAERAAAWLEAFDPALRVTAHQARIEGENARELIGEADLVLDGSDNFATRLAVSDSCVRLAKPLLSAAVGRFQGQVAAFAGHEAEQPCYRCFVGDAFDAEDCDSCAEDGMLGAMAGWAGCFAALHAIRAVLAGANLGMSRLATIGWGKLYLMDGLAPSMREITIAKDPACNGCNGGAYSGA